MSPISCTGRKGCSLGSCRYGVYLAWMPQSAEAFEVCPELLEESLFGMN
jgi:hypothetical protein